MLVVLDDGGLLVVRWLHSLGRFHRFGGHGGHVAKQLFSPQHWRLELVCQRAFGIEFGAMIVVLCRQEGTSYVEVTPSILPVNTTALEYGDTSLSC